MKYVWLLVSCLLSLPVLAQSQVRPAPVAPDQSGYLLQVFIGLILVLALVLGCGWLLKRLGQGTFTGSRHMKVVATLPLGTRERIALIEVGGQQLLIGVTASSINTLHVFDEPVVVDSGEPKGDFAARLKDVLNKSGVKSR